MKEPQIEEEIEEELEEEEVDDEDEDEDERDEEEGDEIEDEDAEDKVQDDHLKRSLSGRNPTGQLPDAPRATSHRQRRIKRVHNQKVLGTTILPVTRVTRAAKQDKDIKIVSKEAVFLISIATEFFVKKLTDSAFERSKREKRVFVKYNDVAAAVKRNPEYDWLEEVIPVSVPLGTILQDPTIPSSSTAVTNQLPTETQVKPSNPSLGLSRIPSVEHSKSDHLLEKSTSIPSVSPIDDDGMEVDDQDELDEEF